MPFFIIKGILLVIFNHVHFTIYMAPSFYDKLQDSDTSSRLNEDKVFCLQNRYEIIDLIGGGGMGTIYLASDLRLGKRKCIVKKLKDDFFKDEDKEKALTFFQREAQVLSSLQHPNIVHVFDFFEEDNNYYLIMEYVEGKNLEELIFENGKPFSEAQVINWANQIIDVLVYIHNHYPPVIYRDLKPSNIILNDQHRVKLIDFGIARPYHADEDNTHVVSQGYSPPEQYWGASEPRSDLYSLGCTLYFLLTGQEPKALQVCSPKNINNEICDHLDLFVQRATAQDIWLRYQSAQEMQEALIPPKRADSFPAKYKSILLIACLILFLAVIAIAFMELLSTQSPVSTSIIPNQVNNNNSLTGSKQIGNYVSEENNLDEPGSLLIRDPKIFKNAD